MNSVYVIEQAGFTASTQSELLTAAGTAYSFMYCDPFAKFLLKYFMIYCHSILGWLVGFKNHRVQNLRHFAFLKFPVQFLRLVRERERERERDTKIHLLLYCWCLHIKYSSCFRHRDCPSFPSLGREQHTIIWILSEQSIFNNKLVYGFKS